MKTYIPFFTAIVLALFSANVSATTHYVDVNCPSPAVPFASWATAATNIQDAVNAAVGIGDTILVTNGVYRFGGAVHSGQTLSNRVSVPFGAGVKIQSVNGPAVTIIEGYQVPGTTNGPGAVRCAFLTEFSSLSGFTLTNGATLTLLAGVTQNSGGGVVSESNCTISNCVIVGNACSFEGGGTYTINGSTVINCLISGNVVLEGGSGGGVYGNTVFNCVISNNVAANGGGVANCTVNNSLLTGNGNTNNVGGTSGGAAYFSTLNNCTLAGNFSRGLGAADGCTLRNSIIYYNVNGSYADCYQCQLVNCCTTLGLGTSFLPANCISNAPLFVDLAGGNLRLLPWSPCVNAGTNTYAPSGFDLDGNPRIVGGTVDMGAYENQNMNLIHYVSVSSTAPVSPFTNWITAATNIQDAIDAATVGDLVLVTNGVYATGSSNVSGANTRVVINKAITVQSANGASVTMIQGNRPTGNNAVRCVYLTNSAALVGFTLTNGAAGISGGGGAWCESSNCFLISCVIVSNTSSGPGAGCYRGALSGCVVARNTSSFSSLANGGGLGGDSVGRVPYNCVANDCVITNNTASYFGGGAYGCVLNNCTVMANTAGATESTGGGAAFSTLSGCIISGNFSTGAGGGLGSCTASNCLITNNAARSGAGAFFSTLVSCKVVGNTLSGAAIPTPIGAGASISTLVNCLVANNTTPNSLNAGGGGNQCLFYSCTIVSNSPNGVYSCTNWNCIVYYNANNNNVVGSLTTNSCSIPIAFGSGNFTNAPIFANLLGGDYHLQTNSPCINSGNNSYSVGTSDLDGNARISAGTVDIGAYEFQSPSSILSYAWAQQFGLLTDGSADFSDSDGDGLNNWQEWIAGTIPTNSASVLVMGSPSNNISGVTVTWQSVSGKNYFLQRANDLAALPAFSALQSNIVGQAGTTVYTDTTATNVGPYFYRVGVQ